MINKNKMKEFSMCIPAIDSISPYIRNIAETIFGLSPLPTKSVHRLKLVFSEIFMNAVYHGSNLGAPIHVRFEIDEDAVRVLIEDAGKDGKRITAEELEKIVAAEEANTSLLKTSGRGLAQIAKNWSDRLEIKDSDKGGICIIFEKDYASSKANIEKEIEQEKGKKESKKHLKKETFAFSGRVDETSINEKTEDIEKFFKSYPKESKRVILDFGELDFFMSTFIGKLVDWKRISDEKNGYIAIVNISEELFELLDLTGISHIIDIERKQK